MIFIYGVHSMHICMVSGGTYPILPERIGAIQPYVYGLAKNLAKTNKVDVFGVGTGNLIEGNLKVHTMPLVQTFQHSLSRAIDWRIAYYAPFDLFLLKNIAELHLKDPIDVLHIHEIYAGFPATLIKITLGIPYVCSMHNEIRTCLPIKNIDKALAVSNYIKDFLIEKRKMAQSKVGLLDVAIELEADSGLTEECVLNAKKNLFLNERQVLLFVGRKCPEKGPQVLIKALPNIVKKNPKVLAIFIGPDYVFGSSASTYTTYLQTLAQKCGVSKNVRFIGHVSNELKNLYYKAADICVCPSIWQDPCPTVIKEAMSFAKPVVATDVGGVSDMIIDDYNGVLIAPDNPSQIANSVNLLLSDNQYAILLGKNGRKIAEQKYAYETVTKKCIEIYSEII